MRISFSCNTRVSIVTVGNEYSKTEIYIDIFASFEIFCMRQVPRSNPPQLNPWSDYNY